MASEVLRVPESRLLEVIEVIRAGLLATKDSEKVSDDTRQHLTDWCDLEEAYIGDCEE